MIVKDESGAILRCLASVKPIIDSWVIVDTGSTDGTQQLIREALADLPGELHERPWVSFEQNRNEALELARGKADYMLMMDADDALVFDKPFNKAQLEKAFYCIKCRDPQVDSYRIMLINNDPSWRWKGLLHEELVATARLEGDLLQNVMKDGLARIGYRNSDPDRYRKDAEMLEQLHAENPSDTRTVFYLAQSYVTMRDLPQALKYYQKRAEMQGMRDEIFWSLYYVGCIKDDLNHPSSEVVAAYWRAYEFDKTRAEPLGSLARHFLKQKQYILANLTSRIGLEIPVPLTVLYVRRAVYQYQMILYFALSAHLLGRYEEACAGYLRILESSDTPEHIRTQVKPNLEAAGRREGFLGAAIE